jgi:hypothetical protein
MPKPQVGREYQHLEDLVYIEGSRGALHAVDFLEKLVYDSSSISVKWDGGIVLYWGRNDQGKFVLINKNGWGRCAATSADQLRSFILSSGKNEPWRNTFAEHMTCIFAILENATPLWQRGYLKGDVLWHPGNPALSVNDEIVFTPNQVTYSVEKNSQLGQQIVNSWAGIAAHGFYIAFGSEHCESIPNIIAQQHPDVVVFGQTPVADCVAVDTQQLFEIKTRILATASVIDQVLEKKPGLADIKNIIYAYVNYLVKKEKFDQIEFYFSEWIEQSNLSNNKKQRLYELVKNHSGLNMLFGLVKALAQIKEKVINTMNHIHQHKQNSVKFKNYSEGYVCATNKIKLVPRSQWKPK